MSTQQYNSPGGHWFILACILPHYGPSRLSAPTLVLRAGVYFGMAWWHLFRPVFFSPAMPCTFCFRLAVISIAVFCFFYKTRPHFKDDEDYFWKKITFKSWDARYLSYSCTTYVSIIPMVGNPWLNISEDTPVKRICSLACYLFDCGPITPLLLWSLKFEAQCGPLG